MDSKAGWQTATALTAIVAIGVDGYVYRVNGMAAPLSAQVTSLSTELAAMSTDSKQAHAEAASLRDQFQAAQSQTIVDSQTLASTEARLTAEVRPDLPVNLRFRKAFLSDGEVAVIRNNSSHEIEIVLDAESSATGSHVSKGIVINPNGISEFGPHEGWAFVSGQRITLSNPGYRPITQVVGN